MKSPNPPSHSKWAWKALSLTLHDPYFVLYSTNQQIQSTCCMKAESSRSRLSWLATRKGNNELTMDTIFLYYEWNFPLLSSVKAPELRHHSVYTVRKEESQEAREMRSSHPLHKICFPFTSFHSN